MTMVLRMGTALLVALSLSACATGRTTAPTAAPIVPRFAAYPSPDIPAALPVPDAVRDRHVSAWNRLQTGDLRGATREFGTVLTQMPGFYPAETGLGFVFLADENYEDAEARFAAAVSTDDSYLPAWVGRAEALLGLERDADAIVAMERVLLLDPSREAVRTRLQLVKFRLTQSSIEAGQRAGAAGNYAEAAAHLEQALAQSPQSTMILNELARAELAMGRLDRAEGYARQAITVEPRQAEWQALLGDVLEARGQLSAAAEAYARADRLDPNEEWRTRSRDLLGRAEIAALPPAFRAIASSESVTRADVAAFVGIHLRELVEAAPVRATTVATDIRTHWAAPWILPVTRAGIMSVYPNHTFQPATVMRRGDLAGVLAELVPLASAARQAEVDTWRAARPRFTDLPATNLFYPAAALATAAGIMSPDSGGRFEPTRPVTGSELQAAIDRLSALVGR